MRDTLVEKKEIVTRDCFFPQFFYRCKIIKLFKIEIIAVDIEIFGNWIQSRSLKIEDSWHFLLPILIDLVKLIFFQSSYIDSHLNLIFPNNQKIYTFHASIIRENNIKNATKEKFISSLLRMSHVPFYNKETGISKGRAL